MIHIIKSINMNDLKEKIIFLIITVVIFLPVRVLFNAYVSDYWLGSFGVLSLIMIVMLYLTKKEKLGYFGRIWTKQIRKISKGKLGILIIVDSIILMSITCGMIYATDYYQDSESVDELVILLKNKDINSISELIDKSIRAIINSDNSESKIDYKLLSEPIDFELLAQIFAVTNELSYGYQQHILLVLLVEEMELLGFVIYFRMTKARKCE